MRGFGVKGTEYLHFQILGGKKKKHFQAKFQGKINTGLIQTVTEMGETTLPNSFCEANMTYTKT